MPSAAEPDALAPPPSPAADGLLRRLSRDGLGLSGAILVALFVIIALFAPWIAPHDPLGLDVMNKLQGPSLAHWAGTDQLGRDTLSRLIWGTRTALGIALSATGLAGVIGLILGMIAGTVLSRAGAGPEPKTQQFFRELDRPIAPEEVPARSGNPAASVLGLSTASVGALLFLAGAVSGSTTARVIDFTVGAVLIVIGQSSGKPTAVVTTS